MSDNTTLELIGKGVSTEKYQPNSGGKKIDTKPQKLFIETEFLNAGFARNFLNFDMTTLGYSLEDINSLKEKVNEMNGLIISGPGAIGKTALVNVVLKLSIEDRKPNKMDVAIITPYDFPLRKMSGEDSSDFEKFFKIKYLCIDNVDDNMTDGEKKFLSILVDKRYLHGLPTIIITDKKLIPTDKDLQITKVNNPDKSEAEIKSLTELRLKENGEFLQGFIQGATINKIIFNGLYVDLWNKEAPILKLKDKIIKIGK